MNKLSFFFSKQFKSVSFVVILLSLILYSNIAITQLNDSNYQNQKFSINNLNSLSDLTKSSVNFPSTSLIQGNVNQKIEPSLLTELQQLKTSNLPQILTSRIFEVIILFDTNILPNERLGIIQQYAPSFNVHYNYNIIPAIAGNITAQDLENLANHIQSISSIQMITENQVQAINSPYLVPQDSWTKAYQSCQLVAICNQCH